jgi:hypothetical protein
MSCLLISPNETVFDYANSPIGQRICERQDAPFPVADPLFWIESTNADDVGTIYYDPADQSVKAKPVDPNAPISGVQEP